MAIGNFPQQLTSPALSAALRRWTAPTLLAGILVLGTVLRLYRLTYESLWMDNGLP